MSTVHVFFQQPSESPNISQFCPQHVNSPHNQYYDLSQVTVDITVTMILMIHLVLNYKKCQLQQVGNLCIKMI